MRIISKFHDYYDGVMKQGMDNLTIYQRESIEESLSRKTDSFPKVQSLQINQSTSSKLMYLGFCGSIFPIVQITHNNEEKTFYNYESLCKYVAEEKIPMNLNKRKYRYFSFYSGSHLSDYEHFFNVSEFKELPSLFSSKNVPVFLLSYKQGDFLLTTNPSLKNLEFFKVKDAFSCFQEIYMFCSGVLRSNENKMVQISNQDKIDKHGFDKWSFRKKATQVSNL